MIFRIVSPIRNLIYMSLCVESPMVSAGTQVSLLRKHGGHSPGQLFSLSLVYAGNGWRTLGSGFSPSRKLGYSVATGSALFSLGYAWKIMVPAGIGVNYVHYQIKGLFSPSSLPFRSLSVAISVDWYSGFWVSVGPRVYGGVLAVV